MPHSPSHSRVPITVCGISLPQSLLPALHALLPTLGFPALSTSLCSPLCYSHSWSATGGKGNFYLILFQHFSLDLFSKLEICTCFSLDMNTLSVFAPQTASFHSNFTHYSWKWNLDIYHWENRGKNITILAIQTFCFPGYPLPDSRICHWGMLLQGRWHLIAVKQRNFLSCPGWEMVRNPSMTPVIEEIEDRLGCFLWVKAVSCWELLQHSENWKSETSLKLEVCLNATIAILLTEMLEDNIS